MLVNTHRPDAIEAARQTCVFLAERGIDFASDRESAEAIESPILPMEEIANANLVITFGGDGTLIRAAHVCSALATPILGVYYGRFGFVTQCRPNEIGAALSLFFDGKARIEDRMMVQTELIRAGQVVATMHSLNEAALQRAATTRMLTFHISVDGNRLARYPADGVMVATPTGSTAYNLSAGGPIVDPRMQALILTAITPHTLSTRPLILRPDSVVRLSMETRGDAVLSCDGQSRLHLFSGDEVRVTKSTRSTRLVSIDEHDFLTKLAERMMWSQSLEVEGD